MAGRTEACNRVAWQPGDAVSCLPGVGPKTTAALAQQGIRCVLDLLLLFPRRYQELVELAAPEESALGSLVRIPATVRGTRLQWLPGRRAMVTVELAAADGTPFSVAFFNQPYLKNSFAAGSARIVEGVLERRGAKFVVKQARFRGSGDPAAGAVQLCYPELSGVSDARLQQWIALCLANVDWRALQLDPLPAGLADEDLDVPALLLAMHRPDSVTEHEGARRHFALREAVALFRRVERARRTRQGRRGPAIAFDAALEERIASRIPFTWTGDQQAAVDALRQRLGGAAPMGVLLQGDVGTGKTAVAVYAALATVARGHQVAFLAPTELLAEQHFAGISRWLEGSDVRLRLLTASLPAAARRQVEEELQAGAVDLVFGTHALFSERTAFAGLGLAIVDEQHRFGVAQRMRLLRKGQDPHVLVMTATPIPRTLTLTLFGDLDRVVLRERPPGRRPARTVRVDPRRWPRVQRSIARHVSRGGRVYVVCPKIGEDGEKGGAVRMHAALQERFRCGLVHGRIPAADRQAVTAAFRQGAFDVLVGTTVLEVGVDVPEATLMVVAGADQFGLATLHQLRGRIGRGRRPGLCILIGPRNPRVAAVCRTADGFALAEEDLRLRGSGEILGLRQSGAGELRALDPVEDLELLLKARAAVREEP